MTLPEDVTSPEFIAARNRAMAKYDGWRGHDEMDPKAPSGHAYGIAVSTRLTSDYRRTHRRQAVDVKPQEVMDCLRNAGVKNWVLMGLHGYVGYLPMPRATQDVDVMVPYSQKAKAAKAISEQWPTLDKRELSQVVRFLDPADVDHEGQAKPVVDIMLPWSPFQETILKQYVVVDQQTGNRIPTIEAAVVAKYAAMISPHRDIEKRGYDASDFRRLIKANQAAIDRAILVSLAEEVWEGGGDEIERFVGLALSDKPFSI
jgi:hypothetical protein